MHGIAFTTFVATWLAASLELAGPLLLAALGEIYGERAGVLNVGIEGTILLGALAAYLTTDQSDSLWLGVAAALAAGLLSNLLLAWMYVTVRADQVVTGIVFDILALGVASYGYRLAMGVASSPAPIPMFRSLHFPGLSNLPVVGRVLFAHSLLFYLTLLLMVFADVTLFSTRFGLALRAVGENPRAADAAGIDVKRMRYVGVLMSGAGAGLGGAYLVLAQIGLFRDTMVSGQGFIALAIVIFGRWRPCYAGVAALAFGAAEGLQLSLQLFHTVLPAQALLSLPYLLTIVAMSGLIGRVAQPAALLIPYVKE